MKTSVNNQQSVIGKQGASGALLAAARDECLRPARQAAHDLLRRHQLPPGLQHRSASTTTSGTTSSSRTRARPRRIDLYVDGVKTTLTAATTNSITNTAAMQIGKVTGYPYYTGLLDEVAIYPAALSQARVNAHLVAAQGPDVNAPTPTITGPATPTDDARPTFTGKIGDDARRQDRRHAQDLLRLDRDRLAAPDAHDDRHREQRLVLERGVGAAERHLHGDRLAERQRRQRRHGRRAPSSSARRPRRPTTAPPSWPPARAPTGASARARASRPATRRTTTTPARSSAAPASRHGRDPRRQRPQHRCSTASTTRSTPATRPTARSTSAPATSRSRAG